MPTKNEAHTDLLPTLCVRKAENVIWKGENKKLKDPIERRCLNWKRAVSFWFYFKDIIRRFASRNMSYQISGHQGGTQQGAELHTAANGKCTVTALSLVAVQAGPYRSQLRLPSLKSSTKHMRELVCDRGMAVTSLTPRICSDLFFLSIPDRILLYVGLFPVVVVTSSIWTLYSKYRHVWEKGF